METNKIKRNEEEEELLKKAVRRYVGFRLNNDRPPKANGDPGIREGFLYQETLKIFQYGYIEKVYKDYFNGLQNRSADYSGLNRGTFRKYLRRNDFI